MLKALKSSKLCAGGMSLALVLTVPGPLSAETCSAEIPSVRAQLDSVSSIADRNTAEHQLKRAQERLEAGKEKSCLRYVEAARAAIEASQMHDD